jgi:uncharacterized membrane protein YdcZ (DUF606 family)
MNSELIRTLVSPVATQILNGLVLDQLGAVSESVINCSINSSGMGVVAKSRVLRRVARNSEKFLATALEVSFICHSLAATVNSFSS